MANKEAFLQRIAHKLGRERLNQVEKPDWNTPLWEHLYTGCSQEDYVELFCQQLQNLGGEVIRLASPEQVPIALTQWIHHEQPKSIISWDHPSAVGQLLKETLQTLVGPELTFWQEGLDRELLISQAEAAQVGITIAEQGLAETGTLVLYNRRNAGRLVSLLPPISVNILFSSKIVPRLTQVLPMIEEQAGEYACINLITGPSRSADIEMDLSVGVHGPAKVVLFLVEDH